MKLRVYLDTPVFSAYLDERTPERRAQTEEFWVKLREFEVATSELAREELAQTSDPVRRQSLLALVGGFEIHPITEEMRQLAHHYLDADVFSFAILNDAVHVAAAVPTRQDVLLSWNFKHLVNRHRRAMVNEVNISLDLPTIEIVAPPEI